MRGATIAAALVLALSGACGDDAGTSSDAGGIDAQVVDAGPCGADLEYHIEVYDWSTDVSVPNSDMSGPAVAITDVDDPSITTPIAPNGRAVLCLPRSASRTLRFESTGGHLPHLEVVVPEAFESYLLAENTILYRVYMLKQADLDALAAGDALPANAHVFVDIQGDNAAFTAGIDATSDAALVGTRSGTYSAGSTTSATEHSIVFRNTDPSSSSTALTLTGGLPCSAPAQLPLEAGVTVSTLAVCVLGP